MIQKLKHETMFFFADIKTELSLFLAAIKSKVAAVALLLAIYLLGMTSIIRADFLYSDDIIRTLVGYRGWENWGRYASNFLAILIHGNTRLADISPLPQIIAILVVFAASILLVYILGDRQMTFLKLAASCSIGFYPYFVECLSYKFDSPYMAVSVLASIVPFLFVNSKKTFSVVSVLFLLIMCMTYQASSGIYILMAIIICFKEWNYKRKTNKEIFSFLGIAAVSFIFALIIFKALIFRNADPRIVIFADTRLLSPSQFIRGVYWNVYRYLGRIYLDFNLIWKIQGLIVGSAFIVSAVATSANKKIISCAVSMAVSIFLIVMSFGAYLVIRSPHYAPRAIYGMGIFIAIISVFTISNPVKAKSIRILSAVGIISLSWTFFSFSFVYGNALAEQKRYSLFREEMLFHDLGILYPDKDRDLSIQLENEIGFPPAVENSISQYPILESLVPPQFKGGWMAAYFNLNYYQLKVKWNEPWANESYVDYKTLDLPVVLDSFYHTIKSDGHKVLVILKK